MNKSQQSRLDALHRIQSFMTGNATALGSVNSATSRQALDELLTALDTRGAAQHAAEVQAASATQNKNELREDLRLHHMQPIAAIARATLAHTPFIAKLRLPSAKVNDSALVQRGTAMADVAGQYHKVFTDEQLPADFIDQLKASVDAVRKAAVARDDFQRLVTQGTQAVSDDLVRASNTVKVLDTLVVKQLKGKADLLAGWRMAKHAKVKPGVPKGGTTIPMPTPATPPAPAPVATTPAVTTGSASPVPAISTTSTTAPAAKAA